MLLSWFAERAGQSGVDVSFKIDGPRERRKWTLILGRPPYVGECWVRRGDFEDLDGGLAWVREQLRSSRATGRGSTSRWRTPTPSPR
ncbi:hypothetical protein [Nocardia sp. NRRL S-836]|uniref:hypothetical protein n=1 Tax=Nocardia sp. NRRL S-836 TaxID=1519492 RepID=UPI000A60B960|nr:hypothetical protein [Nocardia sp. NRRL S-836]